MSLAAIRTLGGGGGGGGGGAGLDGWVSANSAQVLAYYPTDDAVQNGTMADTSGNSRDGTYSNTAGVLGAAELHVSDILDTSGGADAGAAVSYASWMLGVRAAFCVFELDALTTTATTVLIDQDSTGSRGWSLRIVDCRLQLFYNGMASSITGATDLALGVPYTAGWWYDAGASVIRLYLNGAQDASASHSPWVESTSPFQVNKNVHTVSIDGIDGLIGNVLLLSSSADADTIPDLHDAWIGTLSQAQATGGDVIVYRGSQVEHIFTTSGTFTPTGTLSCAYLCAGGGGGGASGTGGGGGAGDVLTGTALSISSAQTITIGAGGIAGSGYPQSVSPTQGGTSSIGSLVSSIGGGRGGTNAASGGNGASGGGGGTGGGLGGTAIGSGNDGGDDAGGGGFPSGGGGGAGAAGGDGSGSTGGAGGAGITWNGDQYGGGGGGGVFSGTNGAAGAGGGGAGGGTRGRPGSGGGGGGSSGNSANSARGGGSGIVRLRYNK
jgi:hypothetical protein